VGVDQDLNASGIPPVHFQNNAIEQMGSCCQEGLELANALSPKSLLVQKKA